MIHNPPYHGRSDPGDPRNRTPHGDYHCPVSPHMVDGKVAYLTYATKSRDLFLDHMREHDVPAEPCGALAGMYALAGAASIVTAGLAVWAILRARR